MNMKSALSSQSRTERTTKSVVHPSAKLRPSEFLNQSLVDLPIENYPMIVDFINIKDNTAMVHSSVDIDKPIFNPAPTVLIFEDYAPFAVHEKKLFFRNQDRVARRIKILQSDTPFFEVSAPRNIDGKPLKQSKIAAGMEVCFIVRFKPQEVRDYTLDLVCVTEREKFLVPVRALGNRPRMSFPDEINFGTCPVKSTARKMVLTQNIGSCLVKFRMISRHPCFTCSSEDMTVDPGGSQMTEIFFTPSGADSVEADIEIEFDKKMRCFLRVMGAGKNVDVSLSTPAITMDPSFISLSSQQTLRIHNHSDVSIKFSWKSFATRLEEEEERDRLRKEISRMEEIEADELLAEALEGDFDDLPRRLSSDEEDGPVAVCYSQLSFEAKAVQASMMRKYRNLRKALEHDPMHFVDDIFEITPVEGTVWAKSEIEITVSFRPDTAAAYSCLSFLDISGREDRLPLQLSGLGIGPHAALSFDIFDMSDVFINSHRVYEVVLTNKGDIPAEWSFIPCASRLSNKFKFSPREGELEIGMSQKIRIDFCSDILGEFSETFSFALQGCEEPLQCVIKGQVIGPTFHFDTSRIDFGIVSYDLLHVMSTELVNTSDVDMHFKLYVPQDGTYVKREFEVIPSEGILPSGQSVEVTIRFTPNTVKVYDYTLAVDIEGVGEVVSSVPLTAECIVSTVKLPQKEIAFGDCFLRYPYVQEMTLINQSNVVETKVTVLPQQPFSRGVAIYTADPEVVVVPVGGTKTIKFNFQSEKLGSFKVPVTLVVSGSQEPPIQAALSCNSIGPQVVTDKTEIRWGNVDCLVDSPRTIMLTNTSLISASCKIFLKMARSKYTLSSEEVLLEPNSEHELTVTANVDDTIVHDDELHVMVHEGDNLLVPLYARGIGTSMFCEQNIKCIDFDTQLTNVVFERKITLENKGRRQQQLKWTNITNRDENISRQMRAKKLTKEGKRLPKSLMPLDPYFTVDPMEITLRPRTATTFIFRGSSPVAGSAVEHFTLDSKVGKERSMKTIINTEIKANVVNPLLTSSEKEMHYVYAWEKGVEPQIQRRQLVLTNKTAIPLSFVLKVDVPFNLNSWEHTLAPDQSVEVSVEFDPMYRDDLTSHSVQRQLVIAYRGHPQKDIVNLSADILFPNLEFESAVVNFGCVLNDTAKSVKMRIKNWSNLDAAYQWVFISSDDKSKPSGKSRNAGNLAPSQVFDILPIRSVLKAGASEDVEFTMFGHTNLKLSHPVLCQVEGGPEYRLTLQGEASVVTFSMDRDSIDFGEILFCERKEEHVTISNMGKVPFNFSVNLDHLTAPDLIEVSPSAAKIPPGEKLKVSLRFCPLFPSHFSETVIFNLAHFDPVRVQCFCKGIFPAVAVTLPRHKRQGPLGETKDRHNIPELWNTFTSEARQNILKPDRSKMLLPEKVDTSKGAPHATSAVPPVYTSPPHADSDEVLDEAVEEMCSQTSLALPMKGKEPSQVAVDVEMHRMVFCTHLVDYYADLATSKALASKRPSRVESPSAVKRGSRKVSKAAGDVDNSEVLAPTGVNKVVVANYLCDFGNVISGTSKKKVFKIMNASTAGPMTWVLDKSSYAGSGFSVDPDKVSKLPEGGVVDIVVKFLARGKLNLGRQTNIVPLVMKNAPTVNILLSVNVCMPDLILSADQLDFEQVQLGCCKKMFVRFNNNTPVTTHWSLRKPGTSKDETKFTIFPMEGSVRAGKSVILEVEYIPTDARKHKVTLNLKIDMNPKSKKTLTLSGEGLGLPIRFDPPMSEFGPILPYSAGQENLVTIINDGDRPLEVYSLDFDEVHKQEDAILQAVDVYEDDGLCRSSIRNPGDPMPPFIMDAYKMSAASEGVDAANVTENPLVPPPYRTGPSPRESGQQQDILVMGPVLSGVTTAATKLSHSLELPVLSVDRIVEEVAETISDMGVVARRLLKRGTAQEEEVAAARLAELKDIADASRATAEEEFKKANKKAKEVPADVLRTPQVLAFEAFMAEQSLNDRSLAKILEERTKWDDAGYGIIIDGVVSKLTDPVTVIKGVALAFPNIVVSMLCPQGGAEGYRLKLSSLYDSKLQEVDDLRKKALDAKAASSKETSRMAKTGRSKSSARGIASARGNVSARDGNSSRRPSGVGTEKVEAIPEPEEEEIVVALPAGDEPWVDQSSGVAIELSDDEYKSLENDQKEAYAVQIKYQRHVNLKDALGILDKLATVLDVESRSLKSSTASSSPSAETGEEENSPSRPDEDSNLSTSTDIMYYDVYMSTVCSAVVSAFSPPPAVEAEVVEEKNTSVGAKTGAKAKVEATAEPAPDAEDTFTEEALVSAPPNIFQIEFEDHSPDGVLSIMKALLPAPLVPPPDKDSLPLPRIYQIYKKPFPRLERKKAPNFRILAVKPKPVEGEVQPNTTQSPRSGAASKSPRGGVALPADTVETPPPVYRWVIAPKSSVQFNLHYQSKVEGKNDAALVFEVMGTHQTYTLFATGVCEVPQILGDARNVFMRRVKGLVAGNPPPHKRFVTSENFYSFGPILRYKLPEWRIPLAEGESRELYNSVVSTNMDVLSICNSGKYKCTVDLGFDRLAPDEEQSTFFVEPGVLVLEEGETKDIKIWAFPKEAREYSATLIACVSNNPQPVSYKLCCWGVESTVELSGSWEEGLVKFQAEIEAKKAEVKPDAKVIKEMELKLEKLHEVLTIDFDRILIGRTEMRVFTLKNTSLLPVAWEIDPGTFTDSSNVTISPLSGVTGPNASINISVAFYSAEPLVCSGTFLLKYSDNEGGLAGNRVKSYKLGLEAEAYDIRAVSLTSQGSEENGDEVDLGRVRVGDYVTQKLKMGNRGKYQIGFKFDVRKHTTASLLKIEPAEGLIEPHGEVDVSVTFCSPDMEVNMKGNKDIRVIISEPLTGEQVEEFNLLLSVQAVFNRFRMQPAKGISFGAMRFDADIKTKRIELRNEGNFEFTYVICGAMAEVEEIDTLDPHTFACFAYATPPARRLNDLGENYKERYTEGSSGSTGSAGASKGKKDAPKKSAPAAKGAPPTEMTHTRRVFDPDELTEVPLPENKLEIGSFSAFPRIGVVQPGESVGIDIMFNPAGCRTVRERLRACLSGIDEKSVSAQWARSFEVVGESCVPAIVTDDIHSIFEEQQIVHSLDELKTGGIDAGASVKIENIGIGNVVYSMVEKMLAFGPVMCGIAGGRSGCVERIKLTNPTKIDVKVSFAIKSAEEPPVEDPKAAKGKGAKDAKKGGKGAPEPPPEPPSAFTVQPQVWEIPPHEHRYVNIHFNPTELKTYRAVFSATVEDVLAPPGSAAAAASEGKNDKTLTFDLGGSGTMPCITVEQPTERNADGNLVIDFGRVHSDRVNAKSFVLRNDGVMTTTCLFEMPPGSSFLFPSKDSSLTLNAGEKRELTVQFAPTGVANGSEEVMSSQIKISVLHNPFDKYKLLLAGTAYSCDAVIETQGDDMSQDQVKFGHVNLCNGPGSSSEVILLRSRSSHPIKFKFSPHQDLPKVFSCSPSVGHIAPNGVKEVTVTFAADSVVNVVGGVLSCSLQPIAYVDRPVAEEKVGDLTEEEARAHAAAAEEARESEQSMRGLWDDSMVSIRPATEEDLKKIEEEEAAMAAYEAKVEAENKKGKKAKPVGPPPDSCGLQLADTLEDGTKMVQETVREPYSEKLAHKEPQSIQVLCTASADVAKYSCEIAGQNIQFKPTYMFQTSTHKFKFKNESHIDMPITWHMESAKRRGTRGGTASSTRQPSRHGTAGGRGQSVLNPFVISPDTCVVPPNSEQDFTISFSPMEVDDYMYVLSGDTLPSAAGVNADGEAGSQGPLRIFVKGEAKRPVCHFNMVESPDYLQRRPVGMKNEVGLYAPIETGDIRVAEVESCGLRVRNTYRFTVINPTNENYEFKWDPVGDPSPFWRCALGAGMLFAGKSTEMVFEFLPEEDAPAESFFKFSLPTAGVSQLFLLAGKVVEPRVTLSTSKIDFHSVVLEGEGGVETLFIENKENIPFSFSFDKTALLNLEGPSGPILSINPRTGTVPPNSKFPVEFLFRPQEEVHYNLNVSCEIRRKPNKLSVNVKGEGYAVHPLIQLEHSGDIVDGVTDHYVSLKPAPHVNYADFGVVQVLDTVTKTFLVTNNGKYNFDYNWRTDVDEMANSCLSLSGGKYEGTLQKGVKMEYSIAFAPQKEVSIDGAMLSFTVAGKYVYNIIAKGSGVQPAVRFSFMYHDFGPCFITSPGGNTVIEETILRIANHDPVNNIAVDCSFQKTRALWAECPPVVLEPGGAVDVPIRFAPRDVKEYMFVIPFIINGTGKINVNIRGEGILPRLELVNAAQRRTNFGLVDVGSEIVKSVSLVNRSVRALPVQLCENESYGGSLLGDSCVTYAPRNEFIIQPRDRANIQLVFAPNRRIPQFMEDLNIKYAGISRKLLTVSGKAQGAEVSLDTDSLPYGTVVLGSSKIKKLSLENTGDLSLTFQWSEASFGPHFRISPLFGKLSPGSEINFDVVFDPQYVDADIRQENIMLSIPGMSPLTVTCSGVCVAQPTDSIVFLHFDSLVRKAQTKTVNLKNPTDKEWFISPAISGSHWSVPNEVRVPPKGSADLEVTYFPLVMCSKPPEAETTEDSGLEGQLFMALPDGTAQLYKLRGFAGPPESCGTVQAETAAKKHCMIPLKMSNWLSETQKFHINVDILEKPSPATFFTVANAVEVAPHGAKDFQVRFNSFVEGTTKAKITFTNETSGEYFFYDVVVKVTSPVLLEDIIVESSVRQSAKYLIAVENPLHDVCDVHMGTPSNPDDWWTCDSKCIRLTQLVPLSGNAEGSFELEYRPLVPTSTPQEHLVTIMTKELGTFKYKAIVSATPSNVRQTLHFEVPLGSVQTETFVFKVYNHVQTTFDCSVKKPNFFTVNKALTLPTVTNWGGDDARLPVTFEPMNIGVLHDILTITSPDGGSYECELVGSCVPPMPLGPFNFSAGSSQDVPFRNCFDEVCQWNFVVDSPHFKVSPPTASIAGKANGSCTVTFQYVVDEGSVATQVTETISAKLFVRCESKPEIPPWIVYLRGKV